MSWHHPPSAVDEEENQKVAEESVPKEDETGAGVANEEEGDELDDLNLDDEGEVSVVIDGLGEEVCICSCMREKNCDYMYMYFKCCCNLFRG